MCSLWPAMPATDSETEDHEQMATSSTRSGQSKTPDPARSAAAKKAAATRKRTAARQSTRAAARATVKATDATAQATEAAARATEAEARVRAGQMRQLAERTVDLPVGVGLVARDTFVSTVRGLATTLGDRARMERELARYERRGARARNRFERQVEQTRSSFERGVRARRARVTRLVGEAQSRIGSITQ